MNEINSKERVKFVEKRIKNAQYWILFFFSILILYLVMLQIVDIRHYKVKAKNQRYSKNFVMRGQIVDRNGVRLAVDQTSYNLYAHREYFDHTPEELAEILSPHLNIDKKSIIMCHDEGTASKLCDDLNALSSGAYLYPARDFSFRSADNKSHEFEQKRCRGV